MYSLLSAFAEWRGWVSCHPWVTASRTCLSGHLLPLTAVGAMFVIMGMPGKLTGAMPSELQNEI